MKGQSEDVEERKRKTKEEEDGEKEEEVLEGCFSMKVLPRNTRNTRKRTKKPLWG